jgi:hypothetical protein
LVALGWALGCSGRTVGHEEEASQGVGLNAGEADEDPGVIQIVICDEVRVRVGGDHLIAFISVHADDEGFAVLMETREERTADFETGRAVGRGFFGAVEGEGDLADGGEGNRHNHCST